ncbi:MAG: POTRA domain-containing protein [Candidatus Baltobacteraceae bacterium]
MTSSLRRAQRAFARCAGFVLALICVLTSLAPLPAVSASAPTIVSVDVSGNVHVPTDKILAVVKAKPGDPYDPKIVQVDLQSIFALGYFSDQVPPLIRQRPGGIAITYRVIENPVITKIVFAGNTHVPNDTLLALMDTSVGQVLNTDTFKQDVLKINSYYDRIGYGGQLPTHVKDLNIEPKSGVLTLQIQEGLTVNNVIIGGDPILPRSVILPVLTIKKGVPYSDELRDKDFAAVQKLYEKYDLVLGDAEGGIDPGSIDLKTGTADVKYNLYVAKVCVVEITGNTKTKDEVIRRELLLKPGSIITKSGIQRDNERLKNTGFFSKVDVTPKACPGSKNPALVTLDWSVTEQRTGQAQVGAGYSGGITGQGLYGTLGFSDNNLNGTGNGASISFERGQRNYTTQLSVTVPYVGKTKRSQKYSFGATLFSNGSNYFYPVYPVGSNFTPVASLSIPVTLFPNQAVNPIGGVISTSSAKSQGVSANVGRRLGYYSTASLGVSVERITNSTTVPSPYFFQGVQPNIIAGPTPSPLSGQNNNNGSFGINATSIANINTGIPYKLNSMILGLATDTRDDVFNPRRGVHGSIQVQLSDPSIGSDFSYSQTTLDVAKFFPLLKSATLGLHGKIATTTGTIPFSSVYTFSDQDLRGYQSVFYGTDIGLGQIELRQPVTADGRFAVALFVDQGAYRVRGAQPIVDPFTNRIISYPDRFTLRGDYGFGFRFDVPQLGLHTIRIDFAKGSQGFHTSFGIGQSF